MAADSFRPGVGLRQQGWSLAPLPWRTPPPPLRFFASACVGPLWLPLIRPRLKSAPAPLPRMINTSRAAVHFIGTMEMENWRRPGIVDLWQGTVACAAKIQVLETEPEEGERWLNCSAAKENCAGCSRACCCPVRPAGFKDRCSMLKVNKSNSNAQTNKW